MVDNRTVINLPLLSCYFVELPDERIDCSPFGTCVRCKFLGRFWAGGSLDEIGSAGHTISLMEWIFTFFVGLFGAITNCLIIAIINRQKSKRAFDTFLLALACFDLIGSIMSVVGSTSTIVMFENWDRGITAHYFVYFGTFTCYFARTGSSLLTLMITLERYLVIAFPMRTWFTESKTRAICILFFFIAGFLAFPRFASFAVSENDMGREIPSVQELDYFFVGTSQEKFWYSTLGAAVSIIDFWVPLPTLLILNVLVCIEIRKFSRRRKELSLNHRKEINAVKMFIPVVVVLFLCNIVGYFHWYFVVFEKYAYREIFLGLFVSVALNSFVNFFFYMRSDVFRNEFKNLISGSWFARFCGTCDSWRFFEQKEITTSNDKRTQESDPYA